MKRIKFHSSYIYDIFISYLLLHPIYFYILFTFTSYLLLHPIYFYILFTFTSYLLLHPIYNFFIYNLQVHFEIFLINLTIKKCAIDSYLFTHFPTN
ncbi:hypothetical protein QGO_0554 [Clostridioides difficile CD212]|nr:hypothetical protein QCQ_0660 [Clostridioides difficile CD49]EQF71350.1 hypothetical protein QGG_0512 [Clostridioides difficile CD201]EQF77476.1 hypothetical protein QGO_0554 [Clostridioides difficile CD212]EQG28574.1 hypothetical protein QII_0543 [Clostridioides difficile DA00114]